MSKDRAGNERTGSISRSFSISATEIPISIFREFDPDYAYPTFDRDYSKQPITLNHPASNISWYQAAEFCNWLSMRHGLAAVECCFEVDTKSSEMRLVDNWQSKKGFRMPTEAEWEFACHSDSFFSWNCGRSVDSTILGQHAWYRDSNGGEYSTAPVGRLKPNPLGLFDMHGNVSEWTIDRYDGNEKGTRFALKGGSFYHPAIDLAPSALKGWGPEAYAVDIGFRIVVSQ